MFYNYFIKTYAIALFTLICHGVLAQTIRYVKPGGGGNGSSWNDASGDLQAMMDASAAGDQVWVAKGTYIPAVFFIMKEGVEVYGGFAGNENNLDARNPEKNETILQGNGNVVVFNLNNYLTWEAILDGFTITGGNASMTNGGGITNANSSPTIANCRFSNNSAYTGSAISNAFSSPAIINCMFSGNSAQGEQGAIGNRGYSTPVIMNCIFSGNQGGAIYNNLSSPVIINCTITGNYGSGYAGGIHNEASSYPIISNCIIWNNTMGEIVSSGISNPTVTYCNVKGGYAGDGEGNIDVDPQFVDAATGNYRLKATSPCFNRGSNEAYENADGIAGNNSLLNDKDLDGNPRVQEGTIDMGAYEFVPLKAQTISAIDDITKTDADPDFDPGATASSGLPVAYVSSNNNIAEPYQDGDAWKIKIKRAGMVTITASQPGNDEWAAAADVSFTLIIKHVPVIRYVTHDGKGKADGSSWNDASGNLQEMINASAPGDQVWVAKGTYLPQTDSAFHMKVGVGIYGGLAGHEDNLAARIPKTNETVLQGNGTSVITNVDSSGLTRSAILDGFTITGGSGNSGGGINNRYASPTIVNCRFLNNSAEYFGGAIQNLYSSPAFINCLFTGNTCRAGGSINNELSTPVFVNCTITGNGDTQFGGIFNRTSNSIFTNCIIWDNNLGGIIDLTGSEPTVTHCIVQGGYNGVGNADKNPQFVNPATGDFQLQAGSPCINKGSNKAYESADGDTVNNSLLNDKDLDGNARLQGDTIDIGAYEAAPLQPQTISLIDDITKTYGDADFDPEAKASSGLPVSYVSADTSIAGAYQEAGSWRITIKKAGTVTITASQPGNTKWAAAPDVSFTLTISKKTVTVEADSLTKVYGDPDPAFTYTVTPDLVAGDAFTGSLNRDTGEYVGTYAITQGTLALNDNYTIKYINNNLSITPKVITVTADKKSKMYGEEDPDLTYTVSPDLIGGDSFSGDLSRAQGEDVGTYTINQGSLTAGDNYSITYVGDQFTITPATITVTAEAKTKTYGDKDPELTYTVSPASAGNALTGDLSREDGTDVGTYAINQGSLTASSNYVLKYVGSELIITPKPITVTAEAKTKTYGDKDPELTYTVSPDLVAGDSFSGTLSRQPGENAGTYTINQGTLALNSNYTITYSASQLTINKAVLTATAGDKTICFGENPGSIDITYSGFKFNDNAASLDKTPKVNIPSFNAAGEYAVTLSGGSSVNYTFNYVDGKLTVLPTPSGEIAQNPTGPGVVNGFQLTAPDGVEYRWSTGETTSAITVRASGSYSVTVTSQQGCSKHFTAQIQMQTLSIPNTFSPNGDGINDYWIIPELINYPNAYVIVVNRDGQTVFETKSFTRWDGRYRGNPLPAGVYFYRVRKEPGAEPVTGWLNLLR